MFGTNTGILICWDNDVMPEGYDFLVDNNDERITDNHGWFLIAKI